MQTIIQQEIYNAMELVNFLRKHGYDCWFEYRDDVRIFIRNCNTLPAYISQKIYDFNYCIAAIFFDTRTIWLQPKNSVIWFT
jgi:hypothetical protein